MSSFDILSKYDLEKGDKRKTYTLADPVCMHTADGEVTTIQGIVKEPCGDLLDIECLILPNSPSLLSLGMKYIGEGYEAGLACPSTASVSSGSGEAPGKPAPASKQDAGLAEQQEE